MHEIYLVERGQKTLLLELEFIPKLGEGHTLCNIPGLIFW